MLETPDPLIFLKGSAAPEGPATLLQSCTGCWKSVEILQSFSQEMVDFSVNYVILSVISFVKRFRKLLRKFTT